MMEPSQRVQQFRGRKVEQATSITHMWHPIVNGDQFRYTINSDHPTITTFVDGLTSALQTEFARVGTACPRIPTMRISCSGRLARGASLEKSA